MMIFVVVVVWWNTAGVLTFDSFFILVLSDDIFSGKSGRAKDVGIDRNCKIWRYTCDEIANNKSKKTFCELDIGFCFVKERFSFLHSFVELRESTEEEKKKNRKKQDEHTFKLKIKTKISENDIGLY